MAKKETKKVETTEIKDKEKMIEGLKEQIISSKEAIVAEANSITMGLSSTLLKLNDLCSAYRKQRETYDALIAEELPFEDEVNEADFD